MMEMVFENFQRQTYKDGLRLWFAICRICRIIRKGSLPLSRIVAKLFQGARWPAGADCTCGVLHQHICRGIIMCDAQTGAQLSPEDLNDPL